MRIYRLKKNKNINYYIYDNKNCNIYFEKMSIYLNKNLYRFIKENIEFWKSEREIVEVLFEKVNNDCIYDLKDYLNEVDLIRRYI